MNYYKATRPDGTDFRTGTINYADALATGEIIRHPAKPIRDLPWTYLSVSTAPADCTGMDWPCRLFRVEPIGRTAKATNLPNKRACSALRVVEELPAWQALGPNGQQVAAIIKQACAITREQANQLVEPWTPERDQALVSLSRAAVASRTAACAACEGWGMRGARVVAVAYVVRDLIAPEQFQLLTAQWLSVMGEPS